MDWIEEIIKDTEAVTEKELLNDFPEIETGEKVIGELPLSLKQLRALIDQKAKKTNDLIENHFKEYDQVNYNESECESIHREILESKEEHKVLSQIFWFEVSKLFNNKKTKEIYSGLGIRKDWSVVELDEKSPSEIIMISPFNIDFLFNL